MDLDTAEGLIDVIYKTGMGGNGWQTLLNRLADSLQAEGAWIAFAQPSLERFRIVAPRSNPDVIRAYQQRWWKYDLTTEVTSEANVGEITSLADTGRKRFIDSKFYNEFWRYSEQPAERLAVNLFVQGSSRISLGLQPKAQIEELTTDLISGAKALLPHLSRAAEIHCALRRLEIAREVARMAPQEKVVLVDNTSRVVFAEDDTLAFLENNDSIQFASGCLSLKTPHMETHFQQLITSCDSRNVKTLRGGTQFVSDSAGNAVLRIDVLPFVSPTPSAWGESLFASDNAKLVAFTDLTQIRREAMLTLRETFKLTGTEACVALELLRGDKRIDVAKRLGVKLSTVRTHMMHVFEKVGVSSRAELIKEMVRAGVDQSGLI